MEKTLPRPLLIRFWCTQLSQSPAFTELRLALSGVRGRGVEVAPDARSRIAKLSVHSRTEAEAVAHRQGLVPSTP